MSMALLAFIGGTIISLVLGYLIAFGRSGRNRSEPRTFADWLKGFDRMVMREKADLGASSSIPRGGHESASRSESPDDGFFKLAEIYRKMDRVKEANFYEQLARDRSARDQEMSARARDFKRKWGHQISDHFIRERWLELARAEAFIQNKGQGQALDLRAGIDLLESYAGVALLFDDARLGSSTVCRELERTLKLSSNAVYRGLDFWFHAKSGQSKPSLIEGYLKEEKKGAFTRSQRLMSMSSTRRSQLLLSMSFPARHKVKTFPSLLKEAEETIAELERELFNKRDRAQHKKQQKEQERKQRRQRQEQSQSSRQGNDLLSDFILLNLDETDDLNLIKKAFRQQAMKYHPDRLNLDDPAEQAAAHERYVEIQKAYERLEKRFGKSAA